MLSEKGRAGAEPAQNKFPQQRLGLVPAQVSEFIPWEGKSPCLVTFPVSDAICDHLKFVLPVWEVSRSQEIFPGGFARLKTPKGKALRAPSIQIKRWRCGQMCPGLSLPLCQKEENHF